MIKWDRQRLAGIYLSEPSRKGIFFLAAVWMARIVGAFGRHDKLSIEQHLLVSQSPAMFVPMKCFGTSGFRSLIRTQAEPAMLVPPA